MKWAMGIITQFMHLWIYTYFLFLFFFHINFHLYACHTILGPDFRCDMYACVRSIAIIGNHIQPFISFAFVSFMFSHFPALTKKKNFRFQYLIISMIYLFVSNILLHAFVVVVVFNVVSDGLSCSFVVVFFFFPVSVVVHFCLFLSSCCCLEQNQNV